VEQQVGEVVVHYVEHGVGPTLVALHGAGVDHRETEVAVEALAPDGRRVYPDLPGMGATTADGLTCNDDVVATMATFVESLGPALLLGHSYGAYVARGIAARRPDLVRGLALVCPIGESTGDVPEREPAPDGVDPGFAEYFVVRTQAMERRYRDHVLPGAALADEEALGRIFGGWAVTTGPYDGPTLIVAGRRDSSVGHRDALALLDDYPHATFSLVDDAGHALMHEKPDLLAALVHDWLGRAVPE
jgi:pimeloyl-ACP methyl ester carboxylesterase